MVFSTVQEYYEAVIKEQKVQSFVWPTYDGDFFPYDGNGVGHVWSGFYTSRPNFKKQIREFASFA